MVIKVIKDSGGTEYIYSIILYYTIRKESERKVLNDLNDLDLNDRFLGFCWFFITHSESIQHCCKKLCIKSQ